jgi:hypothetical protein
MRVGWKRGLLCVSILGMATDVCDAQTHPSDSARVRAIAGCYDLSAARPVRRDAATFAPLPRRIRLDARPVASPFEGYRVTPVQLWRDGDWPASWAPLGRDTVRVVWSTGFHGLDLWFTVRGDTLEGVARPFSDAVVRGAPPPPQVTVRAVRRRCPSPKS